MTETGNRNRDEILTTLRKMIERRAGQTGSHSKRRCETFWKMIEKLEAIDG